MQEPLLSWKKEGPSNEGKRRGSGPGGSLFYSRGEAGCRGKTGARAEKKKEKKKNGRKAFSSEGRPVGEKAPRPFREGEGVSNGYTNVFQLQPAQKGGSCWGKELWNAVSPDQDGFTLMTKGGSPPPSP